jgi:hypothetical protein
MYLPSSKIEVRSLRRNSKGFYGVPVYVSRLLFLRGKSGNLLAARQLLASQKIVNCEWIRSTYNNLIGHTIFDESRWIDGRRIIHHSLNIVCTPLTDRFEVVLHFGPRLISSSPMPMTMTITTISGIAILRRSARNSTCCFTATRRAGDATQLQCQCIHDHRRYSANVGSGFGCFSAKSTLASIILATRIHLPTLGQNGTLHLIDNARTHQRHGGIVHRVHIVPSQGREDSIIDSIPASFISSSDVDDVSTATTTSAVHTFDGELLSTSFISKLHSKATRLSTVISTTSTLKW